MNHRNILAARGGNYTVTRWQLTLHVAHFGFIKECKMAHLAAAPVDTHHKLGAGNQYQEGEANGYYGAQHVHCQDQIYAIGESWLVHCPESLRIVRFLPHKRLFELSHASLAF